MLASLFDAYRYRNEVAALGVNLGTIRMQLFARPDLPLMLRTGSRIRGNIEKRLRPEAGLFVDGEDDLDRENKLIESLPAKRLFELSRDLSALADKAWREEADLSPNLALRLLSGWLNAKAIAKISANGGIERGARKYDTLYFSHIKHLLDVLAGSPRRQLEEKLSTKPPGEFGALP
jgi:hypothetical protein